MISRSDVRFYDESWKEISHHSKNPTFVEVKLESSFERWEQFLQAFPDVDDEERETVELCRKKFKWKRDQQGNKA